MTGITVTIKGTMVKSSHKLTHDYVLFTIYVENGRPQDRIQTTCKVRLYKFKLGEFFQEEPQCDGYTSGVLNMLDAITKKYWALHLIDLSWKMQQENLEEFEEEHQI